MNDKHCTTKYWTDYDEQEKLTRQLVTAAQNGDPTALERLCIFYEPLFRKEMRREIFYNSIGYEEGLSLARLKFIELVLNYNGADFTHFAGYVRCRIHFVLYDEMKKAWNRENNETAIPIGDDTGTPALADNMLEREELAILLKLALKKLTEKQRNTIKALYFEGYSGKEIAANFLFYCSLNWSLPTPQSGQTQSSGTSSQAVPAATPLSGSPTSGS